MSETANADQKKTTLQKRTHRERAWTWWLIPRPFDLVSTSLYLAVLVPFFYNLFYGHGYPITWWSVNLMLCATIALLSLDRLEYWLYGEETPITIAIYLLLARIVFIEVVAWLDQLDFSPVLFLIIPFLAYLYFGSIASYCLAALAWITYAVQHWLKSHDWLSGPNELHYFAVFTLGLIFAISIAHAIVKEKASRLRTEQLLTELKASHQQLQAYSEQVAELATTKERNRLARDIHDSLGHYLTVINVQLEKAQAFRDKQPKEADLAISDAKRLAREALQDVRRSVGTLRATHELFSCASAVSALVDQVRNSSLSIDLHIEGGEEDFSKQALITLYRAVQEGLTNIQKHAVASDVHLELIFADSVATLCLRDNGCGFDLDSLQDGHFRREGGYGLLGLQERLELVGGNMKLESSPGKGTLLLVTVPKSRYL